jgi:YHS domain-containing protein/thioredoxin-related protein
MMSLSTVGCLALSALLFPELDVSSSPGDMNMETEMPQPTLSADQRWLHSFEEARKIATDRKLPLLLHFDATWCGACRRMEAEVLNKPQVKDLLGEKVVGVRIDADRYQDLIREYGISTLPTEVVVQPDGSRSEKFTGAVSLNQYIARLNQHQGNAAHEQTQVAQAGDDKAVRSCLIVQRDGKMVGLGGFSPVALTTEKRWKKGSEAFVVSHEGVDYFLQSADEAEQFEASPERFIPGLHGCDLVELQLENRATTGAIEYGAFYKGKVFFFASVENRDRFENNPTWYLNAMTDARTANNEMFPFLSRDYN